jgi:hypothetical protein
VLVDKLGQTLISKFYSVPTSKVSFYSILFMGSANGHSFLVTFSRLSCRSVVIFSVNPLATARLSVLIKFVLSVIFVESTHSQNTSEWHVL